MLQSKKATCSQKERAKASTYAMQIETCRNQLTSTVPIGTFCTQSLPETMQDSWYFFKKIDCVQCVLIVQMYK